jgi:hypothetical protein
VQLATEDDTLHLRISFNRATGRNVITDSQGCDTLLDTWVLRHRRLYYFVEPRPDSGCWVHAVRIRRGQLQGFGSSWPQMYEVGRQAREGHFPALLRFRSAKEDSIRLRFDIRQLHDFFAAEVDSLPIFHIIKPMPSPAPSIAVRSSPDIQLYPNPASTQATLAFDSSTQRTARLYNSAGQLLRQWPVSARENVFPVATYPAGEYWLRVSGQSHHYKAIRLVVSH